MSSDEQLASLLGLSPSTGVYSVCRAASETIQSLRSDKETFRDALLESRRRERAARAAEQCFRRQVDTLTRESTARAAKLQIETKALSETRHLNAAICDALCAGTADVRLADGRTVTAVVVSWSIDHQPKPKASLELREAVMVEG